MRTLTRKLGQLPDFDMSLKSIAGLEIIRHIGAGWWLEWESSWFHLQRRLLTPNTTRRCDSVVERPPPFKSPLPSATGVGVADVRTGRIEKGKWATDPVEAKAWEGNTMFFGSKMKDLVLSTHFGWIALR